MAASRRLGFTALPDTGAAQGYWRRAFQRLLRNRLAVGAIAIVVLFALIGLLAPLIAPHDPSEQNLRNTFATPSFDHLAGTDNLGRDWFSRVLYGTRLSLTVGIFAQAIILAVAVPIGLASGYFGKRVDNLLMRLTDLTYAFPDLLLIILLRSVLGGSIFTLFLIIGIVNWMDMARLLRGQVLSLKEREFVEAARALGATHGQVLRRHIVPNAIGPVIVVITFGIPRAMFIEASLSFIGFGVDPGTPSWGSMVQEGYGAIFAFPHLVLAPSCAIALLMLAFTFLGDGLRDALDPRSESSPPRGDAGRIEPARAPPASAPEEAEPAKAA